ncbi:MAG: hypothetical protein ACJ8GK_08030 [Luteimonas sp.]
MTFLPRALHVVLAASALFAMSAAPAQDRHPPSIVSIYRIAPGHQVDFLKWMAAREALARQLGVPDTQWYRHLDGDSWDYVAIAPDTRTMDDKLDATAKQKGLTSGVKASLELRQWMAVHTDTYAAGPMTAEQMAQEASAP